MESNAYVETNPEVPEEMLTDLKASNVDPYAGIKQFGLSLVPFTPLKFTGSDALFAYLRIGVYSALAYGTFAKHKKISYACIGAAVTSIATSTFSTMWNKQNG